MKRTSREEDKFMLERVEDFKPTMEGLEDEEVMIGTTAASSVYSSREKKRRLSNDQIKTLEKNFTLENKLAPETRARLAVELGLQPRQIAVWFQNRRARWKTKQLERDYGFLKAKYDGLRVDYDALKHGNQALLDQINELKSKLATDEKSSIGSVKEEPLDTNNSNSLTHFPKLIVVNQLLEEEQEDDEAEQTPLLYKDMSPDSNFSAILNTPHHQIKKEQEEEQKQLMFMDFNSIPCLSQQQELMVFGEELCSSSVFSYELPPSLSWFCSEQWQL